MSVDKNGDILLQYRTNFSGKNVISVYVSRVKATNYMQQKLIEQKGETDRATIIIEHFAYLTQQQIEQAKK